jgi:DNA-binding transcriptional MerR regulator
LRVSEAAERVGVRGSALRHWEQQGLLHPARDQHNHYHLYDEREMHRLQVIVLLREMGYDFDAIRPVLDEMAAGRFERALEAVERQRSTLVLASRAAIQATVAFWSSTSTGVAPRLQKRRARDSQLCQPRALAWLPTRTRVFEGCEIARRAGMPNNAAEARLLATLREVRSGPVLTRH